MKRILFWDVDTLYDFMISDGKLYVVSAEEIIPTLALITNYAREHDIPLWGSVDYSNPDDPDISDQPDFYDTFPIHCGKDTPGQEIIDAIKPIHKERAESLLKEWQEAGVLILNSETVLSASIK